MRGRGDKADNLEEAVKVLRQALQLRTRSSMPEQWAESTMSLGLAYLQRGTGDRAANIEESIRLFSEVLEHWTPESNPPNWALALGNLANAWMARENGDRRENVERAIAAFHRALEILRPDSFPVDCRRTAANLGHLYFVQRQWSEAAWAYQLALRASELSYQASLFQTGKESELARAAVLYRHAAYSLARAGCLPEAVTVLVRGLARGLNETLARDRIRLEEVRATDPVAYELYKKGSDLLQQLEAERTALAAGARAPGEGERLVRQAEQASAALGAALERIRRIPGYERFLVSPDFSRVSTACEPGCPPHLPRRY